MGEILDFKKHEPEPEIEYQGQGSAICFGCDATWQAVAPVGTIELECPQCSTMKGRWEFEFAPQKGEVILICDCGNEYFYMTGAGAMCPNCGILH